MFQEGPSNCFKCSSYRLYRGECLDCGIIQVKWCKENILSNLKKYGFKKSFLSNKWVLGDLVVTQHKDVLSKNMVIKINGELKVINKYGDYKSFQRFMDKLIGAANKRNLIIDKILS